MVRAALQFLTSACLVIGIAAAQESKPRVPPGRDPGGVAVALLSTGIDYTLVTIAARLARDGEGELIAWDFEDNDNRPFDRSRGSAPPAWGGDATAIANVILSDAGVRLVAVRIAPAEPASLAHAVVFVAQTPARIAVVPMWSPGKDAWDRFAQAIARFKGILFIVAAPESAESVYPAAVNLDNVVAVDSQSSGIESTGFGAVPARVSGPRLATAEAAKAAAAILTREPKLDGAGLKRRLLENHDGITWRLRK